MKDEIGLSKIYRKSVTIANRLYNLAITPEKYNDQLWVNNNECFRGILNNAEEGNIIFEMEFHYPSKLITDKNMDANYVDNRLNLTPTEDRNNWIIYPNNLNPEIVNELVKMTNKFHEIDYFFQVPAQD